MTRSWQSALAYSPRRCSPTALSLVGGYAAFLYFRSGPVKHVIGKWDVKVENPFSLIAAAKFGVLFAVILLITKFVQEHFPPSGLYAVAALAGLTDVDAITLSMSKFAQSGEARVAVIAIVIAALSNTLAFVLAGPALGKPLAVDTAATQILGLAAAFFLQAFTSPR